MDKNLLKTLLAEGKPGQVIEKLKSLLPRLDDDLEKEVLLQSGRFEYYLSQKRQGASSTDEQERALAKINQALLEIINKIPDAVLPEAQPPETPAPAAEKPPFPQSGPAANVSSKSYAWVSLVAFLVGAVLMALFAIFGRDFVGTGLEGRLYYIILIPCALAAAAFLFGFMRSYATFSGTVLDKKVELGGPVVGALLVVVGGFYLVPGQSDFDITVCLRGRHAAQAIRTGGSITLKHSTGYETLPFDQNGYATFKKVPADKATFALEVEGFELAEPDKEYILDKEKLINLAVKMQDAFGRVRGQVTDLRSGASLPGAFVTLITADTSFEAYSNAQGSFLFNIPEHHRADKYTLLVKKAGYQPDEHEWYSGDTKPFDIRLKPDTE